MDDNFSQTVKELIALSKEIAISYDNDFIGTAHLILATINHKENSVFNDYFKDESTGLKVKLQKLINSFVKKKRVTNKNLHLTRQAERVLKTTFLEAKLLQSTNINEYHILLCTLRNENDETTKLLNKFNINYDGVKEFYKAKYGPGDEQIYALEQFREKSKFDKNQNPFLKIKLDFHDEYIEIPQIDELGRNKCFELMLGSKKIEGIKVNLIDKNELDLIFQLKDINELYISNSKIDSLENISNLKNLKKLSLNNCSLFEIQDVFSLNKLTELNVSENIIEDISGIEKLKKLKHLDFSSNKIKNLEPLLSQIKKNTAILFGKNSCENLSKEFSIGYLKNLPDPNLELVSILKYKYLANEDYENAARNRDLEKIIESGNKIGDEDVSSFQNNMVDINFNLPFLTSPPLSIIKEGVDSLEIYYNESEKDSIIETEQYLLEGKVLVIGEGGTGKTSFANKMIDPYSELPEKNETTFNIAINQIELEGSNSKASKLYLNIWDFGGQKIYRGTHQLFFSDQCLYVLLDDNREEKTDFSYWLNTVQQLGGDKCSLIIVLNQKHGRKDFSFDKEGFRSQFGSIIKDIIEINLKDDIDNIQLLKDLISLRFRQLPLIGNKIPNSWLEIRNKLSTIDDKFITYDYFIQLCKELGVEDEKTIELITIYFNNIGVFTHYNEDALLRERIYLDSNWLVKIIYEVLDNNKIDKKNGRINREDIKKKSGDIENLILK